MRIYIYQEYDDDDPLGEMITEAYYNKADAQKRLLDAFESWSGGVSPEDYKKQLIESGDRYEDADYIDVDHISLHDEYNAMRYWYIEEVEVQ